MASIVSSASTLTADLSKELNPEGKNVIDIILEEHRLVDALGERYNTETNTKEKQGIAHNIIKLLSIHAVCEEAALYPWMRKNLPNGDKDTDHAIKEHQAIKEDLYKLDQMTIDQPGYDAQLMRALKDTQHHVKEEETDLLPKIQAKSSPQELEQMRTDFLRAKMMAPSRPHPSAPTQPPQNKVVAGMTMPVDAVRDAGRFSS